MRELVIAEARPLAERGAVFRAEWLDRYFRAQPWYRPTGFDSRRLPKDESARVAALARYRAGLSPAAIAKKQEELQQRQQRARVNCPNAVATAGDPAAARVAVLERGGLRLWDVATGTSRLVPRTQGAGYFSSPQLAITRDGAACSPLKR